MGTDNEDKIADAFILLGALAVGAFAFVGLILWTIYEVWFGG